MNKNDYLSFLHMVADLEEGDTVKVNFTDGESFTKSRQGWLKYHLVDPEETTRVWNEEVVTIEKVN
jgi:hypothetical protein